MPRIRTTRPMTPCRRSWRGAPLAAAIAAAAVAASLADLRPASAQTRGGIIDFPARPKPPPAPPGSGGLLTPPKGTNSEPMLVRADEMHYDQTNDRVAAVGGVQIYYNGASLEADRVIYDQTTKRLHAEGNVRLTEADGKITYGEILDLSDDFRDGFVDSLRLDLPAQTRFAATRADRQSGDITVLQNGIYTACEPCADDPRKPPKWQVKATRIIHDQAAKRMYFEDARLEFFGWPIAWLPYFTAPDPTAKRESGFLIPHFHTSSAYGFAVTTPYYWALGPNYDATVTPIFTTKQGPLLQAEWRHRLMSGSYSIHATGIFQLDRQALVAKGDLPGDRDFRGSIDSSGQFRLSDKWVYGWDGTLITDKSYYQDYGLYRGVQSSNLLRSTPDYVLSQGYLTGRGDRSFFDLRAMYFYGFTSDNDQNRIPIVHPVLAHSYTFDQPVFGGELKIQNNLTSLSRAAAAFDPVTQFAANAGWCSIANADPAVKIAANCLLRAVSGDYTRLSSETSWRRTIIDPWGQMFTPFVSMRTDLAAVNISPDPGVANYVKTGENQVGRYMPTAGVEYRYPFINVQSWGTQTIEPIAQLIVRPNESQINAFPNEDSQNINFDTSNLFSVNKYAGWDRVEGGGRLNAGLQYTAQFNRGGFVNMIFGQSYHLFGLNSFAVGGPTNTGIGSGLDTNRSDYVASFKVQPNATFAFGSRFRFGESDFTLNRSEFETSFAFDRWTTQVMYGNYAPQPEIGLLDRREGIYVTSRFKVSPTWIALAGMRYDLKSEQISGTDIGMGYVDDCLILAVRYLTEYAYNSNSRSTSAIMMQLSLRTLGGNSMTQGVSQLSNINSYLPGMAR
jgi:LPS-assembly protein